METPDPLQILVVDDDDVDRLAVLRTLRKAGIEAAVVEAAGASEAFAALRGRSFDCVLLDYRLPGTDGLEVLQEVRGAGDDTPIVMLTGQGDEQTAVDIMKAGAADYISKASLSPERLGQSLRHAVRVSRAERETATAQQALERHAQKLRELTEASLSLHGAASLEAILVSLVERARTLVGTQQAAVGLLPLGVSSAADGGRVAAWSAPAPIGGEVSIPPAFHELILEAGGPVRMTRQQLEAHPLAPELLGGVDVSVAEGVAIVPLVGQDGHDLGLLLLTDKQRGTLDAQDEALLVQLARMASIAIENRLLVDLLERERQRAEEANNAKDEFLAIVSHELRTPLNAIMGWIRMLHTGMLPPEKRTRALEAVDRNARAQAQLVEDLLDVSRVISGKLRLDVRSMDLRRAVEGALDVVRPSLDAKSLQLSVHIDDEVPEIQGDPDRLQQVVWNLLTNAAKFTPASGAIQVRVSTCPEAVMLQVVDSGRGIAAEFLPHVFERFRQADGSATRAHGGLGLGLSIVRHIVELHGGTIRAESAGEGAGATFTVTLPLRRPEAPSSPLVRSSDPAPPNLPTSALIAGLHVLLAEDDVDAREIMLAVFTQNGARVTAVATAAEALRALEIERYDLLMSDIGMPGADGYSLMRRVRTLAPERGGRTPAVALTAFAGIDDRRRARAAGFDAYLTKPVDTLELVALVAKLAKPRA
ncbi:hybrid sensor histidine kinase/response regulator [Chondromyces crocatus]|uniref:histidine kinase n=1 Tax=Chondromyces crocatus TaxID=52 RepID=A0A0K1EHB1_CHOCO|nr:GAF domain-containing hybrid sensor histidine kinase/response regulator [Chondromyces crocatus]AKT39983.1 histidine kinase [Chondromyces crocatus]